MQQIVERKARSWKVCSFRLAIGRCGCHAPLIMGDKSPKATKKQAAQKQVKANADTQKKSSAAAAAIQDLKKKK